MFVDPVTFTDEGAKVRLRAGQLLDLVADEDRLNEEKERARLVAAKFSSGEATVVTPPGDEERAMGPWVRKEALEGIQWAYADGAGTIASDAPVPSACAVEYGAWRSWWCTVPAPECCVSL